MGETFYVYRIIQQILANSRVSRARTTYGEHGAGISSDGSRSGEKKAPSVDESGTKFVHVFVIGETVILSVKTGGYPGAS